MSKSMNWSFMGIFAVVIVSVTVLVVYLSGGFPSSGKAQHLPGGLPTFSENTVGGGGSIAGGGTCVQKPNCKPVRDCSYRSQDACNNKGGKGEGNVFDDENWCCQWKKS